MKLSFRTAHKVVILKIGSTFMKHDTEISCKFSSKFITNLQLLKVITNMKKKFSLKTILAQWIK